MLSVGGSHYKEGCLGLSKHKAFSILEKKDGFKSKLFKEGEIKEEKKCLRKLRMLKTRGLGN